MMMLLIRIKIMKRSYLPMMGAGGLCCSELRSKVI